MRAPRTVGTALVGAGMLAFLLTGCSVADVPEAEGVVDGTETDGGPGPQPVGGGEAECLIGTWALDVARYSVDSLAFLESLGGPAWSDFAIAGIGTLVLDDSGIMTTDIALRTTAVTTMADAVVPYDVSSEYSGSGDWSIDRRSGEAATGEGAIDITNWSDVTEASIDSEAAPGDYSDIPNQLYLCNGDSLYFAAPAAGGIDTYWARVG